MKFILPIVAAVAFAGMSAIASAQVMQPKVPPVPQAPPIQLPQTPAQPPVQPPAQPPTTQTQSDTQTSVAAGQQPYQGTLTSVNGTTAKVQFADGTSQTYTVDATTSAALNGQTGKHFAFRVLKGQLQVAKDVKWATVTDVKDGVATLKDASQKTTTVPVTASSQTTLQADIGKLIGYTMIGTTLVVTSDQAPPPNP